MSADADTGDGTVAAENTTLAVVEAQWLQALVDVAHALVEECRVHPDEDGFHVMAVDPANVGMVDAKLDASAFETYNGSGGTFGIDLGRLDDLLGMADNDQLVTLRYLAETRKLEVSFGGLEYTLALIDPDAIRQEPELPDLDLPAEVTMEAGTLDHGLKAADMVSEHLRLRVTDESSDEAALHMEASGDTDDAHLTLTDADLLRATFADVETLLSLEYIQAIAKPLVTADEVTFEIGEDFPIKMHYERGEGGLLRVTNMVAPRIQSD